MRTSDAEKLTCVPRCGRLTPLCTASAGQVGQRACPAEVPGNGTEAGSASVCG